MVRSMQANRSMKTTPKADVKIDGSLDAALLGLRALLEDRRVQNRKPGGSFADFEKKVHAAVMGVERAVLKDELERADADVDVVYLDGVRFRRVLRSHQTYMTVAGEVRVLRSLFKDRTADHEAAICPMELRTGIVEGFWTPAAAELGVWVVSQMTPQKAEELCERTGNMKPSKASFDRLPKDVGRTWEENRLEFEEALRATLEVPRDAATLVVSLDGVYAPMVGTDPVGTRREAAEAGKIAKGPAGYREVGCATVSFCAPKGELLAAIRFGRMPESKKLTLKDMLSAEANRALLLRPDLRLVALADGQDDNWDYLEKQYPRAVFILDFFHAAEHLGAAIAAVYGDGSVEARRRFADLRHVLLEDQAGVGKVIRALDYLRKKNPSIKKVAQVLAYVRKNRSKMQYATWRDQGLPIGSGVVEAACKTLVTQRMKNSGMRWGKEGGQAVLTVRGWTQSDRFDEAWALLAAEYQAEVTLLNNVVPFRPRAA